MSSVRSSNGPTPQAPHDGSAGAGAVMEDALAQANPAAKGISLDNARRTDPVPLHRGAAKALQDLGAS
ncbi:hypothetical protein ABZ807_20855 [Micromonospora sp. NPDC047548]|uniref:hypothetical protein n=1 Tax=Micromonospora sp. NPDC047548 TaxID=3155624 RepID=UPI0033EE2491